MLREDGIVFDDGTTSRLGETHYLMTTTTANGGRRACRTSNSATRRCGRSSTCSWSRSTEQWAQMAVAGPKARETLPRIVEDDLANEAFPYLAARAGHAWRAA